MDRRPDTDTFAVCVFTASAETVAEEYRELARSVGRTIAEAGWRLVYGGGKVGLMGEVARAAVAAGGPVTGIIPHKLDRRERAFDEIDDLVKVDTLAERKIVMDERSDAFLVLPGGIGTLDELLEVLTTRHLGFHGKPIVLVDPDGFWQPFMSMLEHMVGARVLAEETVAMMQTVTDAAAMAQLLTTFAETPT